MEGNQVTDSPSSDLADDIRDLFVEQCPVYMSIGMSYDEFWYDHSIKAVYYRKAHELKLEERNTELWLQGYYVYLAIGDMVPVLNPFSKNPKIVDYIKRPIPITKSGKEQDKLEKTREAAAQMISLLNRQMAEESLEKKKEVNDGRA